MHRKSIVRYLHLKGLWVHVIPDDLVPGLDPNGVAYNTVARHLGEAEIDTAQITLAPTASPHHIRDSDRAILASVERKSFRSIRELI
jgi:hypothetical protein